jgi:hypothetical protein
MILYHQLKGIRLPNLGHQKEAEFTMKNLLLFIQVLYIINLNLFIYNNLQLNLVLVKNFKDMMKLKSQNTFLDQVNMNKNKFLVMNLPEKLYQEDL